MQRPLDAPSWLCGTMKTSRFDAASVSCCAAAATNTKMPSTNTTTPTNDERGVIAMMRGASESEAASE